MGDGTGGRLEAPRSAGLLCVQNGEQPAPDKAEDKNRYLRLSSRIRYVPWHTHTCTHTQLCTHIYTQICISFSLTQIFLKSRMRPYSFFAFSQSPMFCGFCDLLVNTIGKWPWLWRPHISEGFLSLSGKEVESVCWSIGRVRTHFP